MKKFYIELYDDLEVNGGKLTETLAFNFEDGMDLDEWRESKYCIGLENWSCIKAHPGGWQISDYIFYYNNNQYHIELTIEDNSGYTGEDQITEGKIFKAIMY